MNYNNKYGKCPYCNGNLIPSWGTEEEFIVEHNNLIKTGRKRRIVAYLQCEDCLKKQQVDDSFDGLWYDTNKR